MIRLTLRIFIALLLAAVIWWIGPLLAIGVYRPFSAVLVRQILVALVLLWGFWPLLVRLWAWMSLSSRQLKSIDRGRGYDPVTEQLMYLKKQLYLRWAKRPRSLWRRWMGRIRREYLNQQPWFLVLGQSGSGKTTLMMQFAEQVGADRVDPHHHNWERSAHQPLNGWIGADAVWLDTTGQFVSADGLPADQHKTWTQLLKAIKKIRGKPYINGILLCVDVADFAATSLEDRKKLADILRARVLDVGDALLQKPQIYLGFTGLDKMPGALALLEQMSDPSWEKGFGFILPDLAHSEEGEVSLRTWNDAFADLEIRLQQQMLYGSPEADGPEVNHAQLDFLEAFGRQRSAFMDLVQQMFSPSQMERIGVLRGVWWGSVAEVVSSGHLAMGEHADRSGIRSMKPLWSPLISQMLLERFSVIKAAPRTVLHRVLGVMKLATVGVLAAGVLGWLAWGYLFEINNLEQTWARFSESRRLAEEEARTASSASAPLLEIAGQMQYARQHAAEAQYFMPTGYFEHKRVADVALSTYQRHLSKTFMPELFNQVQRILVAQTQDGVGDVYLSLKVYLQLARPERRQSDDLVRWIDQNWAALSVGQIADGEKEAVMGHARALFLVPNLPATPEDPSIVQAARAKAAQVPSVTRVLQHIRDQGLPPQIADISLSRAAGLSAAMTLRLRSDLPLTDAAVPGWYTRAGFLDVFKPRLNPSSRAVLEEESWVLRDQNLSGNAFEIEKAVEKLADATRRQFLQDYIKRWQTFLSDITVRSFTGLDDAAQLAGQFVDPQSPLAQLIRFVGRETTLTGNYQGDVDSWIDRQKHNLEKSRRAVVGELAGEHYRAKLLPEHVVEDHFQSIRGIATQLADTNAAANNNPMSRLFDPLYRQLGLVNGAMQAGQVLPEYDAFSRLRGVAARQPEPLRGIMLDLIDNGSSQTVARSANLLNKGARGAARGFCDSGVVGRYPFQRSATSEVGVHDFERLFSEQGPMFTHFRDNLAQYVDTSTSPWRSRRTDEGNVSLVSPSVLRSYESADQIRRVALDEQGKLRLSSILRIVDMDPQLAEVTVDIAGQTLKYAHGVSAPKRFDWTSSAANLMVRVQYRSVDGRTEMLSFNGPWALFKFFDNGFQSAKDTDRRETQHRTSLGTVTIEWQSTVSPGPLWSGVFSGFRCP